MTRTPIRIASVAVLLLMWVAVAHAGGRKRVVVLGLSGPKAEKFHDDIEKIIQKKHTVVPLDKWNMIAEELDAGKGGEKNLKKVAKKLKIDGIVEGKIEKRREEYIVRLKLREGKSGEVVGNPIDTKAEGPRIDGKAQRDITDELVEQISQLDSNRGGGGDEDEEKPGKKKVASKDDDDEDAKPAKKGAKPDKKADAKKTAKKDEEDEDEGKPMAKKGAAAKAPAKKEDPKKAEEKKDEEDEDEGKPMAKKGAAAKGAKKEDPKKAAKKDEEDEDEGKPMGKKGAAAKGKKEDPKKTAAKKDDEEEKTLLKTKKDDDKAAKKDDAKAKKDEVTDAEGAKKGGDDETEAPKKQVAMKDDDDASVDKKVEHPTSATALSPGERALDLAVGASFMARSLKFNTSAMLMNKPIGYKQSPIPGGYVDATFYPLAFGHSGGGFL